MLTLPQAKDEKSAKVQAYIKLLDQKNCQTTETYARLMDTLILIEPSAEAYFLTGKYYYENANETKSLQYFEKRLNLKVRCKQG